ncbi:MAG: hypothetical protein SPK28_03415 [Bacilli bacterium]|nr:hypothetical protein [Bacilli bacterium]
MFNKGLIIVNAYCVYASVEHQAKRLAIEFKNLGIDIDIKENNFLACYIKSGEIVNNIGDYDFVVYLDKDFYIAKLIEKIGIPVFNNVASMMLCDDKMQANICLAGHGIETPTTLSAPFCSRNINEFEFYKVIKKYMKYPLVCKESYSSLAAQTILIGNDRELKEVEERMVYKKHYYQEYVESSRGHDYKAILINKKVVAAIDRKTKDDFMSNNEFSSLSNINFVLPEVYQEVAEKAAELLDLDYCGVDLLIGDHGQPIICDVDSNAFFNGIESSTGVNIALLYAKYICKKVYGKEY